MPVFPTAYPDASVPDGTELVFADQGGQSRRLAAGYIAGLAAQPHNVVRSVSLRAVGTSDSALRMFELGAVRGKVVVQNLGPAAVTLGYNTTNGTGSYPASQNPPGSYPTTLQVGQEFVDTSAPYALWAKTSSGTANLAVETILGGDR